MKFAHAILLSSLYFIFIATANADDSFRCGSYIVEIGEDSETVLQNCGNPTSEEGWTWTYDRGPEKFQVVVQFGPEGSVSRIEEKDTL